MVYSRHLHNKTTKQTSSPRSYISYNTVTDYRKQALHINQKESTVTDPQYSLTVFQKKEAIQISMPFFK